MKDIKQNKKQTKLSLSKFYEPKLKIEHKSKINIKNESNKFITSKSRSI